MTTTVITPRTCRHCRRTRANRPKGLCWSCYHTPDVRALTPPVSKFGRRSDIPTVARGRLPEPAVGVMPGSAEKVVLMCRRAAAGLALFHPDEPSVPPAAGSLLRLARHPTRIRGSWKGRRAVGDDDDGALE